MPKLSRVTDIWTGICCCHTSCIGMAGIIIRGAEKSSDSGLKIARKGDPVIGYCGHPGVIASGSEICTVEGKKAARTGDSVVGCTIGTIITGSDITTCV